MHLGKKTLQESKEKKISIEDLNDRYFINSQDKIEVDNILKLLNENICNFKKIVDKCKSIKDKYNDPSLYRLLYNKELFQELTENTKLNTEDLKSLLNTIDNVDELDSLCVNTPLIKYVLNEFMLDKEIVDRFETIIKKTDWRKEDNIHTIFDLIEYHNKNNEVLKLNELNEKVYLLNSFDLNEDQREELSELLKDNEIAQNRLIQIIENHLESNYDFESLMKYLNKHEKKSILNI